MKMLDYALTRGVWPHQISEIVISFNLSPRHHGAEAPLDADALYRHLSPYCAIAPYSLVDLTAEYGFSLSLD